MQTLDDYVSDIIALDTTPTPRKVLVLSRALVDGFTNLIGQSESRMVEYGMNLYWRVNQLVPGPVFVGLQGGTAVDMHTAAECQNHEYVGDCHTHPYLKKMGAKAMLGPSSSDYMEWWLNNPKNFNFGLHFVVSGDSVFLILTRNTTRLGHASLQGAMRGTVEDTNVINEPIRSDIDLAETFSKVKNTTRELDFWKSNFPDHARQFTDANLAMNVALADSLAFEYYRGKLDSNGVILERQSTLEVHGPAMIIGTTLKPVSTATWIADNKVTRCTSCKRSFTMTFRKHHCRNCGRIFCDACSSSQAPVRDRLSRWGRPKSGVQVARVCDECYSKCR
ncbi:hypothetical protein EVC45_08960 [Paraburkholderia sp. UYCP14C]|uniref:FYVE zinc finger domain-containing protein n=1 Tax=Paraburkholderia sp. UYCP14C TaxID=2511130 RepID=UPI001020E24A|nr:FYVE zinc finger domain-containing protein [Paraburkholderia sp. UYCP14C]RZF30132.1 hypothetical protein EVC45_08960 [Paraburkholderia sp. UYCP14C]